MLACFCWMIREVFYLLIPEEVPVCRYMPDSFEDESIRISLRMHLLTEFEEKELPDIKA